MDASGARMLDFTIDAAAGPRAAAAEPLYAPMAARPLHVEGTHQQLVRENAAGGSGAPIHVLPDDCWSAACPNLP